MVNSKKDIPIKNYFILGIILLVSMFLVYYCYLWFQIYDEDRLNTPIMDKYLQVINYNELSSYIGENGSAVIYVSFLGDETVRNFENDFKEVILDYSLKNDILYMDLSDELSDNLGKEIYSLYGLDSYNIPSIIVFEDGVLVDTYDIVSHNYNVKKVQKHLVSLGVINSD